jgi:hypothetical protein
MRPIAIAFLFTAACASAPPTPYLGPGYDDPIWTGGKSDSSASGTVKRIDWDAYVFVATGSSDRDAQDAVRREVKSAIGALWHGPQVSLRDRDARSNVDASKFRRETLAIAAADGSLRGTIDRVRYHYTDLALVANGTTQSSLPVTLLVGDYASRLDELKPECSDDQTTDGDSLWYHYDPTMSSCGNAVQSEAQAIAAASAQLAAGQIADADTQRRFLTVTATLSSVGPQPITYPEYADLFGFGSDRQKVVVYSLFGVAAEPADNPDVHDPGFVETLRYVRTLRAQIPQLQVVDTQPFAMLLDFTVDGQLLHGVTYEDVANWVVDGTGWPAAVGSDAGKQAALLAQVQEKFLERWIVWQVPVQVTRGDESRRMIIEVHLYYGREDGRPEYRQVAEWRYLEAFWYSDIFSYSGHSHFGHGPLEPFDYNPGNFPARYQVFLFNSCLSYNYYDVDFLEMHSGAGLNVVSNGLPAYWDHIGESTAKYVLGLAAGGNLSFVDILRSMQVAIPGWSDHYEPMRIVTGDTHNRFDPAQGRIGWSVAP